MSLHDHSSHQQHHCQSILTGRIGFILLGLSLIVGALLFSGHRDHVFGVLVWLPLLACPLMHLFMHKGHGGHAGHEHGGDRTSQRSAP